ncbi:MAG: ion transporter [Cryomorphaceae bacterium]|nr:ion transporter [Cryomorphaceae bacterium]
MYLRRLFLNDYFILGIIFINVVVIFIGGFSLDISSQKVIEALDNFFTVLFVIEAGVKIKELSASKYFNDSWNIFDFILVVIAIPSLVFFFLPNEFLPLNSLLVFRILRVFKFFRFIKFIPNINKVINGF